MATTLEDIHQDIIQKHILPCLDGPSLWITATATASSSHLRSLCSDPKLWADVSMSAWPSITHPRVHEIISTFANGYRTFFEDSFPSLFTYRPSLLNSQQKQWLTCDHPLPSELISIVDIRYKGNIIYSTSHFTNTTTDHLLSSPLQIVLHESTHVPEKFDGVELTNNEATLSHLIESVALNWIIINPTQKRAGNISSIEPLSARNGWMPNEFILQYVTVLPGCDPNEIVKCRIQLLLLVAEIEGDVINLQVKEVSLKLQDLFSRCLNGKDFMVVTQRAILEENNVRRTVIDDERRFRSYKQIKEMKRDKHELLKKQEQNRKFFVKMNYVGLLVSFCFCVYSLNLLLQ